MGLFTDTPSTALRPASSARLKRRSLGRSRQSLTSTVALPQSSQVAAASELNTDAAQSGSTISAESIHVDRAQINSHNLNTPPRPAATSSLGPTKSPASQKKEYLDEESELYLADLESDNIFLYLRQGSPDSALGTTALQSPEPDLIQRIDTYVATHYLDCFGMSHFNEHVRHHNRLVPFLSKAPRFLSIHSLKRKELERDYTDVVDTVDTCPRKELCLGRCLLGFRCPTRDLSSAQASMN